MKTADGVEYKEGMPLYRAFWSEKRGQWDIYEVQLLPSLIPDQLALDNCFSTKEKALLDAVWKTVGEAQKIIQRVENGLAMLPR